MTPVLLVAAAVCWAPAAYRWLRVAQREHYEPGRVSALALLWATRRPENAALWLLAAALVVAAALTTPAVVLAALAILAVWPFGLATRPRTAPLRFTPRLLRVLAGYLVLSVAAAAALAGVPGVRVVGAAAVVALGAPLADLALAALKPVESALSARYVRAARAKLNRVNPVVVAITGSYGKTSTKRYAAHLAAGARAVVASPASFNNLMGLSRTVNDRLTPGTEVFVAEMGTYGPGEIRRLCEVFRPSIAAITTIGEAHLERMGSRETIVRAKSEIVEGAETVVLNVDVPELAELADRTADQRRVVRCSTRPGNPTADVVVAPTDGGLTVWIGGKEIGVATAPPGAHETNIAVAVGIADALGVPHAAIGRALASLPPVDHRATVHRTDGGPVVVDDTYNANPPGAERAVATARELTAPGGRLWVVTPGMVELGDVQDERNRALAERVAGIPRAVLAVVGRTNRAALLAGAARHPGAEVLRFDTRPQAVAAVAQRTGAGDVVLYENDLPDHYP